MLNCFMEVCDDQYKIHHTGGITPKETFNNLLIGGLFHKKLLIKIFESQYIHEVPRLLEEL